MNPAVKQQSRKLKPHTQRAPVPRISSTMVRAICPQEGVDPVWLRGARTRADRLTVSSELGAQSARSQASREKGTVNMPPPDEQFEGLQEMPRSELEETHSRHSFDKTNEAATESKESRSKKG
jgi:hypothetical protein